MNAMEVQERARQLKAAHGDKAIREAAEKAEEADRAGDAETAKDWRRIESALLQMRGANET